MTNPQSEAIISSDINQNLLPKSTFMDQGNPRKNEQEITKKGGTLRQRLLTTILPSTLIPLLVASSITINITSYRAERDELANLEQIGTTAQNVATNFLEDALNLKRKLESNSLIIETAKNSEVIVRTENLLSLDIDSLEQRFQNDKLLNANPDLNTYLAGIVQTGGIAEVIITDTNGFNLGYSSPTSDFVQSDEEWWQIAQAEGEKILNSVFDESTDTVVIETVAPLINPVNQELLGISKISIPSQSLENAIIDLLLSNLIDTRVLQIIDVETSQILTSLTSPDSNIGNELVGGEVVTQLGKLFQQNLSTENPQELLEQLLAIPDVNNLSLQNSRTQESSLVLTFKSQERFFKLLPIPNTNFVVVMSVEGQEIANAGNELALIFGSLALFLVLLTVGSVVLLAQNFSQPIVNLTDKAKQVAEGDLDVKADLEGTEESRTLAYNFNTLVAQVKELIKEQENIANQQKDEKEKLEMGIYQLLEDLQDAMDGDLTVRASLSSMEMSTVADLCNAILDSLQDIALQVKEGTAKVNSALAIDEKSIQELTKQAIEETQKTRATLGEVEQMSKIVAEIAENANQASTLADDAYAVTQNGSQGMDETVSSIINLRSIVGETAKKMKRLGESSQKISQVVSLIEEIALKTNLLAINASVEASRAGEQGQGFTVVAEQVGALAEQSASATKEIAKIVAEIQRETQEVSMEMESSTTEVVNTTRLVEGAKNQLELVLARSRNINELMRNISLSTVSQAQTSQTVEDLMEEIAQQSEERLKSSEKIVESMQNTAHIAQQLESAVDQFKIS
ncbi:MAG: methyl-accepting chemotaxis protein [Cyanobacterium sp. T60_A2020_053]|nr:methyl-accepting chemotaxis protein [Cyanobacterium sp. T60_A2020_053]